MANPGAALGAGVSELAQKASEAHAPWRSRTPRSGYRAGLLGPRNSGPAADMAASLWMGDVSEGGCAGPRRMTLSVTGEEESEAEGSWNPKRVEVNGEGSSLGDTGGSQHLEEGTESEGGGSWPFTWVHGREREVL